MWSVGLNSGDKVTTPVERALAQLAARQHGVVTRAQLRAAGVGAKAIEYRLRVGRLHPLHRAVYASGTARPRRMRGRWPPCWRAARGAVLSHRSAAALWGLGVRWGGPIDVTVSSKRRQPGIRVHRSSTLTRRDVTRHYGIPVTTLARTLLDLADILDAKALTRAVNEARLHHRAVTTELAALIGRSPGRATTRLGDLLDHGPTRSTLEDDFLAFAARHGLPAPEVNQVVAGYEVDMLWRAHRLVVELDSRTHHEHRFEEDRDRDADLLTAGFPVLRITPGRLSLNPDREAARLKATLAAQGSGPLACRKRGPGAGGRRRGAGRVVSPRRARRGARGRAAPRPDRPLAGRRTPNARGSSRRRGRPPRPS